jgi:hypothetical protein
MKYEFTTEQKENMFTIDIGRPSFYEKEHFLWWQNICNFIENTDIKIQVNSAYESVKQMAFNNTPYLGGGFSFCFWFLTKEDRKQFINTINKDFKVNYLHDIRNIRFVVNQDKTVYLIIDKKYLAKTNELYKDLQIDLICEDTYQIVAPLEDLYKLKYNLHDYSLDLE